MVGELSSVVEVSKPEFVNESNVSSDIIDDPCNDGTPLLEVEDGSHASRNSENSHASRDGDVTLRNIEAADSDLDSIPSGSDPHFRESVSSEQCGATSCCTSCDVTVDATRTSDNGVAISGIHAAIDANRRNGNEEIQNRRTEEALNEAQLRDRSSPARCNHACCSTDHTSRGSLDGSTHDRSTHDGSTVTLDVDFANLWAQSLGVAFGAVISEGELGTEAGAGAGKVTVGEEGTGEEGVDDELVGEEGMEEDGVEKEQGVGVLSSLISSYDPMAAVLLQITAPTPSLLALRYVTALEERNRLSAAKLSQSALSVSLHAQHLAATDLSNHLMAQKVELSKGEKARREREVRERRGREELAGFARACADELVAGLLVMLVVIGATGWRFAGERLAAGVAACQVRHDPALDASSFLGVSFSRPDRSLVTWLRLIGCKLTVAGQMLLAFLVASATTYIMLLNNMAAATGAGSAHSRPATTIVLCLGCVCGYFGFYAATEWLAGGPAQGAWGGRGMALGRWLGVCGGGWLRS
ncbi:unnamed protein product [Closterium sp. Yama58-4]|nr:unnamed protein product [Closterium sp. Yama58-4]